MIYTQIVITIFIVFAISRAILRFRESKLTIYELFGWITLWVLIEIIVWKPRITSDIALILGIGRGADLIIYTSVVILFYLIFRTYVKLEEIERDITSIVRMIALKKPRKEKRTKKK